MRADSEASSGACFVRWTLPVLRPSYTFRVQSISLHVASQVNRENQTPQRGAVNVMMLCFLRRDHVHSWRQESLASLFTCAVPCLRAFLLSVTAFVYMRCRAHQCSADAPVCCELLRSSLSHRYDVIGLAPRAWAMFPCVIAAIPSRGLTPCSPICSTGCWPAACFPSGKASPT